MRQAGMGSFRAESFRLVQPFGYGDFAGGVDGRYQIGKNAVEVGHGEIFHSTRAPAFVPLYRSILPGFLLDQFSIEQGDRSFCHPCAPGQTLEIKPASRHL